MIIQVFYLVSHINYNLVIGPQFYFFFLSPQIVSTNSSNLYLFSSIFLFHFFTSLFFFLFLSITKIDSSVIISTSIGEMSSSRVFLKFNIICMYYWLVIINEHLHRWDAFIKSFPHQWYYWCMDPSIGNLV